MTFAILDEFLLSTDPLLAEADHLTTTRVSTIATRGGEIVERILDGAGDVVTPVSAYNVLDVEGGEDVITKLADDLCCLCWYIENDLADDELKFVGRSQLDTSPVATEAIDSFDFGGWLQIAPLTESRATVFYRKRSIGGEFGLHSRTLDISTTTCSANAENTIIGNYDTVFPRDACAFSSTHTLCVSGLADTGTGDDGLYAILIDYVGDTPALETKALLHPNRNMQSIAVQTATGEALVLYGTGFSEWFARKVTRSGASLILGPEVSLWTISRLIDDAKLLQSGLVVIFYKALSADSGNLRTINVIDVPSLNDDEFVIPPGNTSAGPIAVIDPTRVYVQYQQDATLHEYGVLLSFVPPGLCQGGAIYYGDNVAGIAQTATTSICVGNPDGMDIQFDGDRLFLANSLEGAAEMVLYADSPYINALDLTDNHKTDKPIEAINIINSGF